jgi:hypothetical protein
MPDPTEASCWGARVFTDVVTVCGEEQSPGVSTTKSLVAAPVKVSGVTEPATPFGGRNVGRSRIVMYIDGRWLQTDPLAL